MSVLSFCDAIDCKHNYGTFCDLKNICICSGGKCVYYIKKDCEEVYIENI